MPTITWQFCVALLVRTFCLPFSFICSCLAVTCRMLFLKWVVKDQNLRFVFPGIVLLLPWSKSMFIYKPATALISQHLLHPANLVGVICILRVLSVFINPYGLIQWWILPPFSQDSLWCSQMQSHLSTIFWRLFSGSFYGKLFFYLPIDMQSAPQIKLSVSLDAN